MSSFSPINQLESERGPLHGSQDRGRQAPLLSQRAPPRRIAAGSSGCTLGQQRRMNESKFGVD